MTRILILLSCVAVMLGATVWFASAGGAVTCDPEIAELPPPIRTGEPQTAASVVAVELDSRSVPDGVPDSGQTTRLG